MIVSASINSELNRHSVEVSTNDNNRILHIPPKDSGYGSSVNGGELLVLALATCFCNDLYREAKKRNLDIREIIVKCHAEFGAEGEPGSNFQYQVKIISDEPNSEIAKLILHTDEVAEIQNTMRKGAAVTLQIVS